MSFTESFWSVNYETGFLVLFAELHEGVSENSDFVALFTRRAEIEASYGARLQAFTAETTISSTRPTNLDYVSFVQNAFGECCTSFERQGAIHTQIAESIRESVVAPFSRWCEEHAQRVNYLDQTVREKYRQFCETKSALEKLQKRYFNKCRVVEEFKSRYDDHELAAVEGAGGSTAEGSLRDSDGVVEEDQVYTLGEMKVDSSSMKQFLTDLISNVPLTSHKVPILGTYYNVSTGSAITQWMLDNMPELRGNISKAELCGQSLLSNGFLRSVGSVGASKSFINSSQFYYQWKPVVFDITKISEFDISSAGKSADYDPVVALVNRTPRLSTYLEDMKQAIGVNSVDYSDKTQYPKLLREAEILDAQYFDSVRSLDAIRCDLEETIMDHYTFMQKCELDRLRAIKKVMYDFVSLFATHASTVALEFGALAVIEETIRPTRDLKFLIENYATGRFRPHVTLYDNYYNSTINQTFGVDLSVRARFDKKAVPLLVQAVLSHLDSVYPELMDDTARVSLWTHPVHLSKVHKVRAQLNGLLDPAHITDVIRQADATTVVNVLKLYFLELPDGIVLHDFFDLIRTLYENYPAGSTDDSVHQLRINGLQNSLIDLPVCNLATLDAILTHLNRLMHIVSSKNAELSSTLKQRLCREFGSLVLRPEKSDALSGKGVHSFNLALEQLEQNFVADLFDHRESIFGELRRRNSIRPQRTNSGRPTSPRKRFSSYLEGEEYGGASDGRRVGTSGDSKG